MRSSIAVLVAMSLSISPALGAEPVMETVGIAAEQLGERAVQISGDLVDYALSLVGVQYRFGGMDPDKGLDCSGFVGHVFRQAANLPLPHNAYSISTIGQRVPKSELQPGDLVFFNTLRRSFSHVGIYIGESRFVHASSRKDKSVTVANLTNFYWARRFDGARRILAAEPAAIE